VRIKQGILGLLVAAGVANAQQQTYDMNGLPAYGPAVPLVSESKEEMLARLARHLADATDGSYSDIFEQMTSPKPVVQSTMPENLGAMSAGSGGAAMSMGSGLSATPPPTPNYPFNGLTLQRGFDRYRLWWYQHEATTTGWIPEISFDMEHWWIPGVIDANGDLDTIGPMEGGQGWYMIDIPLSGYETGIRHDLTGPAPPISYDPRASYDHGMEIGLFGEEKEDIWVEKLPDGVVQELPVPPRNLDDWHEIMQRILNPMRELS
jgi:hypothetical protein